MKKKAGERHVFSASSTDAPTFRDQIHLFAARPSLVNVNHGFDVTDALVPAQAGNARM